MPGALPPGWGFRPRQVLVALSLVLFLLAPGSANAVPAGTVITNTARADFLLNGNPAAAVSNSVSIITTLPGIPSDLEVFRYAPSNPAISMTVGATFYFDGAGFSPLVPPVDPATGMNIDISVPVPLEPASVFTQGESVFFRLIDPDGNTAPAVANTVRVAIEDNPSSSIEILLLTETGPDTGIFTGYVLSGAAFENAYDGVLYGSPGSQFTAMYTDFSDGSDTSFREFVFDPDNVLWVAASAGKETVSVGDYLPYTVAVENTSPSPIAGVVLRGYLPLGFHYLEGTARVGGSLAPDPVPSSDGRSLVFSLGEIQPGGTVTVTFVTAVGAGARTGRATAQFAASSGPIVSNTSAASVKVVEDLMLSRNTVMGRVLSGACGGREAEGVKGVAVFLEDGTRVVTDEKGRFHFEGVKSGTHVVQMDLESVPEMYEVVVCDDDTRQAGRPWSRFVDLSGGALWRVDFNLIPKAPKRGKASLMVETSASAGQVIFHVGMNGERVPLKNVRLRVVLPDSVEYVPGTARLGGKSIGDPDADEGELLWNIGELPEGLEKGLVFQTRLKEGYDWLSLEIKGDVAEVSSSASLIFDTAVQKDVRTPPVTNVLFKVFRKQEDVVISQDFVSPANYPTFSARLTTENRDTLRMIAAQFDPEMITGVTIRGHSDSVPISERGRRIYSNNYELSRARAQNVVLYLMDSWNLSPEMFTIMGVGSDHPLASNETAEGRKLNRRVEHDIYTITVQKRAEVEPVQDNGRTEMIIIGLRPGEVNEEAGGESSGESKAQPDPTRDLEWFERENGTLRWVLPESGYLPHIPSLKLAVVHPPHQRVKIQLNGEEINPLHFDSTTKNNLGTAALSLWRGVDIREGDNRLEAVALDGSGAQAGRIERTVHYSGPPVDLDVMPELSRLVADGRTTPMVAVRLTDKDGYPARKGIIGQYYVQSPYRTLQEAEVGAGEGIGEREGSYSIYSVQENGIAYLKLEPTTRSGEAVVRVLLKGEDREIPVWLNAQREDWILVGLAEGTAGYNIASGNMESLEESGAEEDLYTDGRLAFFARGRVKGKYLLTMSYDTNGPHGAAGEGHHGTIDPDTYYTLYGDATEQGYEAPTSRKLYLKIERENFYALFGDTSAGLTVSELARYNRRITGFRSELRGTRYSYNLFASETQQGFVKDEIPGDGTSGLYRLSAGRIVVNSESVTIEVRDRFQSHVVLSGTPMDRHTDYNIDYDEGTLFFKSPVSQRDAGFNPVFIVVDYETTDPGATGITYGARGEMKLPDDASTVGLSVIHEDQGDGEGDLAGIDAKVNLSGKVSVKAEAASSRAELFGAESEGSAYLLEVRHDSDRMDGKVYIRQQDEDFGLGQQRSSESGMRKAGAEGSYRLTQTWDLTAGVFAQENLETGEERLVEELGATREKGRLEYSASIRQATDTTPGEAAEKSRQVTAGVGWESEDGRWELGAGHEQSLGDNGNPAYPTRTRLRSDYRLTANVSLSAEQEYTDGDETSVSATRFGLEATPWEGGKASSSVNREYNENGERVYAATGLSQTWQVTSSWKVSAGFEGATILEENTTEPLNDETASISSEEEYKAVSLGTGYCQEKLEANLRLEVRNAQSSDKWGLIAGVYNEPAEGIGLSSDLKHFRTEGSGGDRARETDLGFGLVYRPWVRYWTFLDKLKLVIDEESGGTLDTRSWKVVNNFNANYRPHDDLQVSFLLGTKYVKETIEGQTFDGYTHLVGSEGRWDLTNRWDIGGRASVLTTEQTRTTEYGLGASLGYGLMENVWLSFGYNFLGFEDADFSRGDFTAQGPFIKFRLKFDQEDLKGLLKNR